MTGSGSLVINRQSLMSFPTSLYFEPQIHHSRRSRRPLIASGRGQPLFGHALLVLRIDSLEHCNVESTRKKLPGREGTTRSLLSLVVLKRAVQLLNHLFTNERLGWPYTNSMKTSLSTHHVIIRGDGRRSSGTCMNEASRSEFSSDWTGDDREYGKYLDTNATNERKERSFRDDFWILMWAFTTCNLLVFSSRTTNEDWLIRCLLSSSVACPS